MTLIKSISGIRGTIGGKVDEALTPIDAVKICSSIWHLGKRESLENQKLLSEETHDHLAK